MRTLAALFLAALLAGCATSRQPTGEEIVVVVPAADGHVGGVVVRADDGRTTVLDKAWAGNRMHPDGRPEPVAMTKAQVNETFAGTLAALPGRPTTYLLYFLEGKDEFTPASRVEVDKIFAELKRRPAPDILVIGHTDTVGGLEYNDKLSVARADRVREMLTALGIPASRIQTAGRGKRELLVNTEDNISEPRNRRVEINVR